MRKIIFIILFSSFLFALNNKIIVYTGVYPGIDILKNNKKDSNKKDLYSEVFIKLLKSSGIKVNKSENISKNLYKISQMVVSKLNTKAIKKNLNQNKFVSIDDLQSRDINIENIVISFLSLDNILCFNENANYKNGIGSRRIDIYNIFSFYAIELSSMRIIYSSQYILPMSKGVMSYDKDTYLTLLKENSQFYKEAVIKATQLSLNDKRLKKALDATKHNGMFLNAKNSILVKSYLSKKSSKRVKNPEEFEFFTNYLLSSQLAKIVPVLPPYLSYKLNSDDSYSDNSYINQFNTNIDDSIEILSSELGFKVQYKDNLTKLKVKGRKLYLPEFTFPIADYMLDAQIGVLAKTIEKNSVRKKKLIIAQVKPKLRFSNQAKKEDYKKNILDKNNINKGKFVYKTGYYEYIPHTVKDDSDIYFYNAMFNLFTNKKDKKEHLNNFKKVYNLECLIQNNCN